MFHNFLESLRSVGIPASTKELLVLLEALDRGAIERSPEAFYYLSRAVLVKDEAKFDRFDQVFAATFKGIGADSLPTLPEDWLHAVARQFLSAEDMAKIEALGSWEEIMAALKERLAEQKERHEGGNKWIGTGGTSPFGNGGFNPAGVRIGGEGVHGKAIKVWEQRMFRNLDDTRQLGIRNIKVALRRLRRFAREGAAEELDLDATIEGSARQGWLDIQMRPERHNAVKLLLLFDVGGSMDPHVRLCEELFSAARSEFKHLEFFYFHNCPYEGLWTDNSRRWDARTPTEEILRKYGPDYRLILVGDAAMSPYEITHPGGSIEHSNPEAGAVWIQRLTQAWPASIWINPAAQEHWQYSQSTALIHELMAGRMFPLTVEGLTQGMRELSRKRGRT